MPLHSAFHAANCFFVRMPFAFFSIFAMVCLLQPPLAQSSASVSILLFCSAVRSSFAKVATQASFVVWFAAVAQQAFSPAKIGEVASVATARRAKRLNLIIGYLRQGISRNCSFRSRYGARSLVSSA